MGLGVIYQKADEVIELTLQDEEGTAINPNDCEDIIVAIYQRKEDIMQAFNLTDGSIIVEDADAGKVRMLLDAENTANVPPGRLYVQIILVIYNAQFDKDRRHVTEKELCDLKASVND